MDRYTGEAEEAPIAFYCDYNGNPIVTGEYYYRYDDGTEIKRISVKSYDAYAVSIGMMPWEFIESADLMTAGPEGWI